jgi:quinol monooxygenase YgiN
MIRIDRTNAAMVGLELFSVAQIHQEALIETIVETLLPTWTTSSFFQSASVHRSLDGVRVFIYSQWQPRYNPRSLPYPIVFNEFFPADSLLLEVTASRSRATEVEIIAGERVTHLAEFRMIPSNQPEMIKRTSQELDRAMNSPGLLSATFHRSLDGTRMFNYGQWESIEAFEAILKQPGFNPDKPYWDGLARNEFHLYHVVHMQSASGI